jgi:hypothetical protein
MQSPITFRATRRLNLAYRLKPRALGEGCDGLALALVAVCRLQHFAALDVRMYATALARSPLEFFVNLQSRLSDERTLPNH